MDRCRLTVGGQSCDIAGFTNTHIQCAMDRVALAGGGQVELSEGAFRLRDSVHLRCGVRLYGCGEATVLRKEPMISAAVACFLGYGHTDVIVDRPEAFELGDGVYLSSDQAGGFHATVGTLIRREGDTWFTDRPHASDYTPGAKAMVRTLFPLISAADVTDAAAEGLVLDGNAAANPVAINGCRGGGAFAIRSARVRFGGLLVRDCNTEGISFQTCDDLEIADCRVGQCTGNGLHPGSGSNRFHIHGCRVAGNGACGLFYCLRVRDSVLEDCLFEGNGSHGVSVGSRDTGNVNRGLTIRSNGGAGVYIRRCCRADAAHHTRIEHCTIEGNCAADGEAQIVVQGATEGTEVIGCTIRRRPGRPGILIQPEVLSFHAEANAIEPPGPEAVVDRRGEPVQFDATF